MTVDESHNAIQLSPSSVTINYTTKLPTKETPKLRIPGPPLLSQSANNAGSVSISWRHHIISNCTVLYCIVSYHIILIWFDWRSFEYNIQFNNMFLQVDDQHHITTQISSIAVKHSSHVPTAWRHHDGCRFPVFDQPPGHQQRCDDSTVMCLWHDEVIKWIHFPRYCLVIWDAIAPIMTSV